MSRPPGDLRVVADVAVAFVELVSRLRPRTLALSGGGTALRCYEALAAARLDWSGTEILLGDERWVPVDHPDSNEGQARRAWLDAATVAAVRSLRHAGGTLAAAADAYDRLVAGLACIDLVHLGLGSDGHTASLFPGSPALDVDDRHVVATGDERHEWPRVTLTYPGLALAATTVVTVAGEGKREALRRVLSGDVTAPAARLHADRVVWLVDSAAAG